MSDEKERESELERRNRIEDIEGILAVFGSFFLFFMVMPVILAGLDYIFARTTLALKSLHVLP